MLAVLEDGGDSETVRLELHDSILGDSRPAVARRTLWSPSSICFRGCHRCWWADRSPSQSLTATRWVARTGDSRDSRRAPPDLRRGW